MKPMVTKTIDRRLPELIIQVFQTANDYALYNDRNCRSDLCELLYNVPTPDVPACLAACMLWWIDVVVEGSPTEYDFVAFEWLTTFLQKNDLRTTDTNRTDFDWSELNSDQCAVVLHFVQFCKKAGHLYGPELRVDSIKSRAANAMKAIKDWPEDSPPRPDSR